MAKTLANQPPQSSRNFHRTLSDLFQPHEPIPPQLYLILGSTSVLLVIAIWSAVAYSGQVKSLFLPSPTQIIQAAGEMISNGSLFRHIWASSFVIITGWVLAALLAVPVGILMGSLGVFAALIEPIVNFMRYLPVSALIPLLILYIGIGIEEKIAVVFLGTFFQLILLVADATANVPKALLECAYTLGTKRSQIIQRVLVPATLPNVMDHLRITMGWAWTYLVVAELVAADRGLGYMIMNAQRGLRTDYIFVGLLVIGGLGFLSDYGFKWLYRKTVPWSQKV